MLLLRKSPRWIKRPRRMLLRPGNSIGNNKYIHFREATEIVKNHLSDYLF